MTPRPSDFPPRNRQDCAMPETTPPPRAPATGPSPGCLVAGLAGISAVLAFASAESASCDGGTASVLAGAVFPLLTVIFLSTGLVIGTRRAGDRRRRKVMKIVGSVAAGIVAGFAVEFVVVLVSFSRCFD